MAIREVQGPSLGDIGRLLLPAPGRDALLRRHNLSGVKFTGSGKGAIAIALRYLAEKKVLENKLSEVMVADWIGYWVYGQIQPFAFPSKRYSNRSRAIMVYHQYGFPQKMDEIMEFARKKDLVVIEDCAHALASSYKGKPLGSFGDFSIYSFSKWCFCFALGGIKSNSSGFEEFCGVQIANTPFGAGVVKDKAKLLYELNNDSRFFGRLLNMSYAIYGDALKPSPFAAKLLVSKLDREISTRRARYGQFLKETAHLGICSHLEQKGVTPYVIPIKCPPGRQQALLKSLASIGVQTGAYHFDMNRNMLSPKFEKCIWIPCHAGIKDAKFEEMTAAVCKTLG